MTVAYSLNVSVAGATILARRLATASTEFNDWKPIWPKVETWFIAMEIEQFASEGHGGWPSLADSTVKKRGSAHPILFESGRLFRSLTHTGQGWYSHRTQNSIELGTNVTVGKWNLGLLHQLGTGRSQRTTSLHGGRILKTPVVSFRMPPRPPIDPRWKERSDLIHVFASYVHQIITGEKGPGN